MGEGQPVGLIGARGAMEMVCGQVALAAGGVASQATGLGEKMSEQDLCPDELLRGQEEAFACDIEPLKARAAEFVVVACPGCGSTDARFSFEKRTFRYVTCESCKTLYMNPRPSPEVMAQACRDRGIEVVAKRIEGIADKIQSADVAVAFEVIEHHFEPRPFLRQSARLLRPGGLFVLSCPNGQGFDIALLGSISLAIDPEHVNLFNPGALSLLVGWCGFEVMEVSTPGRLDAGFVHTAIAEGRFDVSRGPFLKRVLVDGWERLGWPFQKFLAANGLSSHMWLAARKR